jgi:hypothetical protein
MASNWISPLDMCAAGGVLDYDAAADLMDLPQRFVGNPKIGDIPAIDQPLLLPPNTKIQGDLKEDCFGAPSSLIQNPSWKKWLFGGTVALGVVALLLSKGKAGKATKSAKTVIQDVWTSMKDFGSKVLSCIKKPFAKP